MIMVVKGFYELTNDELHDIYKLRSDVFVVEQDCVYPDLDGYDKGAYHIYIADERGILAYCRVLDKGKLPEVSIGRVISAIRRCGYGSEVMKKGIETAREKFGAKKILIEAQAYAQKFYEGVGFKRTSDFFLLDGIDHIKMELEFD